MAKDLAKTQEIFQINSNLNCVSENLIYKISCKKPKCKSFVYIGQTKRLEEILW